MWCDHCNDIQYCVNHCPHGDCIMTDMECAKAEGLAKKARKKKQAVSVTRKAISRQVQKSVYYEKHREERLAYQREYDRLHKERKKAKARERRSNERRQNEQSGCAELSAV